MPDAMHELIRSNDPVLLSFAQSILSDEEIDVLVADQHISVLEGSIGVFPRRLMVLTEDAERARAALIAAGLGAELWDGMP